MRLLSSEFRKLFSNRLFIICFALFFIVNAVGFYFLTSSNEMYKYELSLSNSYNEKLAEYLKMDKNMAISKLSNLKEAYQIASNIQSESSEIADTSYVNAIIEQYRTENPKAYEMAEEIIEDGFNSDDMYVNELLCKKFSYIDEYKKFISEMQSRKDSQLKFSVFSRPNTFAYNNIEKTPQDFAHLNDVEITPGYDLGIVLTTSFQLTDYLLLILVLLVCVTLFSLERDNGLTVLIKSTSKGRQHTAFSKLAVTLLIVAGMTLFFFMSILSVGQLVFGLGDLNRSIQSVPEFMNCTIKCSVLGYLVIWLVQKMLTFCAIALVSALLFILIKSTNLTYIVIAILFSAEFCLYNFVAPTSPLNHLKYINLFYYLNSNELIGNYLNLDFFTKPVNTLSLYFVFLLLCIIVILPLCVVFFSVQKQFSEKGLFSNLSERIRRKVHIFSGSASIFKGECFKHYVSSKVLLVIAFVAVFGIFALNDNINIVYQNGEDVAYATYLNRLEGELTPDKEKFIDEEQKYFDELNEEKISIESSTTITEDEKTTQLTAINNILDTRGRGFERVMLQYETIKATGEKLGITPCFVNYTVGSRLMTDSHREWILFSLFIVILVFALSGVFAYEHKHRMSYLICSAKNGKGKLVVTKFLVALLTYSIVYTLIYLPYMINFIATFGTDIFSNPLAFLENFQNLESTITISQAIILEALVHIALSMTAGAFILFLSNILKNKITAMVVSTSVTLIPCMVVYFSNDLRIFSLFMENRLWIMILIIIMSIILSTLFALLTYRNFIGKQA